MSSESSLESRHDVPSFLRGGGEMGQRMRSFDWTTTPLGAPQRWPQSLKTAVRIMLTSRQPIWIGWGEQLSYMYNDPYKSIIGGRHPWALGRPVGEVWREIWSDIQPMLAQALQGEEGTYVEQQLLIMERHGYPEETYYTFSYSPIPDDDGGVGGIICANTEDTQSVISGRQLGLLLSLAASAADSRSWQQVCEHAANAMGSAPHDLPFALIYTAEPGSETFHLASVCGIERTHPGARESLREDARFPWPVAEVLRTQEPRVVTNLPALFGEPLPTGAWLVPPSEVAVLPVPASGETGRPALLVVGLNPFRVFDDSYRAFLTLIAGQVGANIAQALAYEDERRRAEALAEIDRAKTTFFSNVSHEFRTPLTLMLTPLEDVLAKPHGEVSADARELLQVAHRNSLRLLKLVNTLLDFSRIEAGRIQAQYEPVNLSQVTQELASNFRSAMEKAGLRFIVRCEPLPQPAYVDRDMWEKIVLNLLSNAFKFTFEGEIEVRVEALPDGKQARLRVRDTGTGISAEELPHVFERFRRVEGARGRSFEGSGIGLALVQELVKLHGGTIDVASVVGQGSELSVCLPLGAAHLPEERLRDGRTQLSSGVRAQAYVDEALGWLTERPGDTEAETAPRASVAEDLRSIAALVGAEEQSVLLADDNADMRNYVQRLLKAAGYRVRTVNDGEEALAAIRREPPDLVLSDVMMPRLDGFGLLAALRADPQLRELPVLLLSARAGEESRVEGLQAGADDYLTKPFAARELLARVEVNLRLARIRRDNARQLREEAAMLEALNRVGNAVAAETDLERAVQVVTDAATQLTGAQFGAFFYNVIDTAGDSYMLYTLSGVPREQFSSFPMPRATGLFGPTFRGEGTVRLHDVLQDPRFGKNAPYHGMPEGHLPVRSYLAASVLSNGGSVLGGLFFGHSEPGRFDERAERIVTAIAAQAGIAMEKARLYRAAQHEIEQRKRIELALRESEQVLERKVLERTQALVEANQRLSAEALERERAEEALRQSQKMESIGQLTGGVAHDFNNLLTVIIGNLETTRRQLRTPQANAAALNRATDQAMRGAQRAASLTQRLLAFSRQQPLDPRPLDINRLVASMSDLLRRTLGEQIAIETVLAGGLWHVSADPNQLEVAILNLAVNARDAMPAGGKLTIETANAHLDESYVAYHAEVVPGQYVALCITDNGAGMSRETVQRAFEPFFTTKDVGHGTGLGLSQVYGFVKQSGGHVKIYSEPGEGTTVKIYLPRIHVMERIEESEPVTETPVAHQAEVVLVVEDDADVRAHTTGILRELGYRVVEAVDGRQALQLIEEVRDIDVVFTDVGLPGGMNGGQLADAARRVRPDLKVLFTTGYARNAIVHDGRLDPGVQLITKPFSYAALAAKLRGVLDAAGATGRILIVEDEALVQMLLIDSLDEMGFSIEAASTAIEALSKIKLLQGSFDAAIVDLGLPDAKGDALLNELRRFYPQLPVVIASGTDDAPLRLRLAGQRHLSFLMKPYTTEQLRRALGEVGVKPPLATHGASC